MLIYDLVIVQNSDCICDGGIIYNFLSDNYQLDQHLNLQCITISFQLSFSELYSPESIEFVEFYF